MESVAKNGDASFEDRAYTLPQLAAVTGIDYRTLHNWLNEGLIRPARKQATGSGTTNLFDSTDALQLCILADLRRAGFERRALKRTARSLRKLRSRLAGEELLAINGDVWIVAKVESLPEQVVSSGPLLLYATQRALSTLQEQTG